MQQDSVLNLEGLKYFRDKSKDELSKKVDKASGKGLSTNDYTTAEKKKLAGIAEGANKYTHPSTHDASMIVQDSTHRFVSDTEKNTWYDKYTKNEVDNKFMLETKIIISENEPINQITGDFWKEKY